MKSNNRKSVRTLISEQTKLPASASKTRTDTFRCIYEIKNYFTCGVFVTADGFGNFRTAAEG